VIPQRVMGIETEYGLMCASTEGGTPPLDPEETAAELFRARALAARPGQVINDDDLAELLTRLDGIPLAIELAAARTRSLSVGQIAERLPGRPDLLTAARDAPARQRTLTAVIEWSWNLLDAAERRALARLALLPDGFTLLPAEALIGIDRAWVMRSSSSSRMCSRSSPASELVVTSGSFLSRSTAPAGRPEGRRGRHRAQDGRRRHRTGPHP